MFRAAPLQHAVLIVVPVIVAVAQLANSAVTDLSFAISVPFAVVLLGFTGLMTQYNLARFRRQELEHELFLVADHD